MGKDADIIIVGSGMGGATLAAALAPTGLRIQILERGNHLKPTAFDRDEGAIFRDGAYRPQEQWLDSNNQPFCPGNYAFVGGNSKLYGAALLRFRESDFRPTQHWAGTTPGWPFGYDALESDYSEAEDLYKVRGLRGEDPTEPPSTKPYPFTAIPDEPDIANLRSRLKRVGLRPSSIPLGVDLERWLSAGRTGWDAFPNTCGGKMDAETCGLTEALKHSNVSLRTGITVEAAVAGEDGQIVGLRIFNQDRMETATASVFVLAAGAVNTAALLLRSANDDYPSGLSNTSDHVGRNFMNHNCSAVIAFHPFCLNRSVYQKTLMVNDFYHDDGSGGPPLGNIQMLGKVTGTILAASSQLPLPLASFVAKRSFDFYAMSEDLPSPESRVTLVNGHIKLDWQRSNLAAHEALVKKLKQHLKRAGFPFVLSKPFDRRTPSHQCGTARMGINPATSVVDPYCRSHDHRNLFIVDASVLPTSAAVNPALTIAALALRAGRHIAETEWAA